MRRFHRPLRRSPLRQDPVTPAVHAFVLARDRGCVAATLDREHECRDQWGNPHLPGDLVRLTLDHIRLEPGGKRRSVPSQLVALCFTSHIWNGWATSHRPELRAYLRSVEEPESEHAGHVDPCSSTCVAAVGGTT